MGVMAPVFACLPAGQAPIDARTWPRITYAGSLASVVLPFCWMQGAQRHHWIGGGLALAGVALAQAWHRPLRAGPDDAGLRAARP